MDSIKVTAKTVEDALTEASILLGTSKDNIEYTVIEKGSAGFFGIGGKKAVIEAKKKYTDDDLLKEVFGNKEATKKEIKKEAKKEIKKETNKDFSRETSKEKKEDKKEVKDFKKEEKEEKKEEKKEKRREKKPEAKEITKEIKEETAKEESTPKQPRIPANPEEAIRRAETFLKDVLRTMEMDVEVKSVYEDDTLSVDLSGEDMGLLIGKRGQTLDSLQYLTSLVVNKGKASYVRVKLDTEDYRERRKATLENLAKNIAFKVKKTRRPVFLEPMNPYERRIIHSALQNDPYVTTHSEGDEPCRKVVVTLRKKQ
ncbi:protein jag [bacterium 1XD42-54]|nr:protein jag [bacterium 1XD42-54]